MANMLDENERGAVIGWVMHFNGPGAFDVFLGANGTRLVDLSSLNKSMPEVAMDFVVWVEAQLESRPGNDPGAIVALLQAAALHAPHHEAVPALEAAATRLAAVLTARAAEVPVCKLPHVDGVPMVNRGGLRAALQGLVDFQTRPPVVMVHGARGTGRTHSWWLIRKVAEWYNVRPQRFRLERLTAEEQSAKHMYGWMVGRLHLQPSRAPTNVGTTPQTAGAKFAEALSEAVEETANVTPAWLVFDSVDHQLQPEVTYFLRELAHRKLDDELAPYILFLLGAGPEYGVVDDLERRFLEPLTAFLPTEVRETAQRLNDLGSRSLDQPALDRRIDEMIAQLNCSPETSCGGIARDMAKLIQEVGA